MVKRGGSRSRRSQQGGQSAWQYQLNNLGDGWKQFENTFGVGGISGPTQSNNIVQNRGGASLKGGKRGKRGK